MHPGSEDSSGRSQLRSGAPLLAVMLVAAGLVVLAALASNHAADYEFQTSPSVVAPRVESSPEPSAGDEASIVPGVIFVVVAAVIVVFALTRLEPRQLLRLVAIGALAAIAALGLAQLFTRGETQAEPLRPEFAEPATIANDPRAGADGWVLGAIAVTAVGVALIVAGRRRPAGDEPEPSVATAVRTVLIEIDAIADPRSAVITAYARLEHLLGDAGFARHRAETSREYVSRILVDRTGASDAVTDLGALYERAQYSRAAVTEQHRLAAIDALGRVRAAQPEVSPT